MTRSPLSPHLLRPAAAIAIALLVVFIAALSPAPSEPIPSGNESVTAAPPAPAPGTAAAAPPTAPAAPAPDPRLDWWREARFGMFIHWGLYAVPAGEWNGKTGYGEWIRDSARIPIEQYDRFRGRFNAAKFDAGAWVRLAKQAGMKYIVITTKHHDGFSLFDSAQTDFDVMSTPFRRDIMRELSQACRQEGIRIGWYYSIMDWHHPDYLPRRDWETRPAEGADYERYVRYMKAQVKELLSSYGPIGVMWFDGEWEGGWTETRGRDMYGYVRSLQPQIIVNNRVGRSGGDFGLDPERDRVGDFGTPEQKIPAAGVPGLDWETCLTMNDHWGYNRADRNFKSVRELIRTLADVASKGGNLLLNVGPRADGEFPEESIARLQAIGRWMQVNGESIHGTKAGPQRVPAWGRCTQRTVENGVTRLYLHVFDWPASGLVRLDGILNEPVGAFALADPGKSPLAVSREEEAIVVKGPPAPPDADDSVIVLDVRGRADTADPPAIEADTDIFVGDLEVRIRTMRENVVARYTTDGSEPQSTSPVAPDPLRIDATSTVRARLFRGEKPVSPVARAVFTKVTPLPPAVPPTNEPAEPRPGKQGKRPGKSAPTPGMTNGVVFDCVEGNFEMLPDFDASRPARKGAVADFDLSRRTRDTQFAMRFRGYLRVPADGAYRFFTRSDDGSRLLIGGRLVVNNDGLHSAHEESGVIALGAGLHPIEVAMFEQSGGFELTVSWSGPGLAKQRIPASSLFRPTRDSAGP